MAKRPFRHNPKLASHHAKLCRIMLKGLIDDEPSKDSQRQAAQDAIASHTITRIPTGKRTRYQTSE